MYQVRQAFLRALILLFICGFFIYQLRFHFFWTSTRQGETETSRLSQTPVLASPPSFSPFFDLEWKEVSLSQMISVARPFLFSTYYLSFDMGQWFARCDPVVQEGRGTKTCLSSLFHLKKSWWVMGLHSRFEDAGLCVLDLGRGSMQLGVWLHGRERET